MARQPKIERDNKKFQLAMLARQESMLKSENRKQRIENEAAMLKQKKNYVRDYVHNEEVQKKYGLRTSKFSPDWNRYRSNKTAEEYKTRGVNDDEKHLKHLKLYTTSDGRAKHRRKTDIRRDAFIAKISRRG